LVIAPPLLQANGSSCQVDCSSAGAEIAMPYLGGLVSLSAAAVSSAHVAGGSMPASSSIFLL
jgi:hypothetical protein